MLKLFFRGLKAMYLVIGIGCAHEPVRKPVPPAIQKCDSIIKALEQLDEAMWESFYRHGCAYHEEENRGSVY
jgi:hypothetical protein